MLRTFPTPMIAESSYERRRREFRERRPTHYCGRCTSVLFAEDASCLECGARPVAGWPELGPIADPWLGKVIGERYLLTRGLGAGASGAVYRAESMAISRQFAVKIVALDPGDPTMNTEHIHARLNREVAALGQLRNPHIVSFYDVFPIDDTAVALLMDLIDGRTLQDVVAARGSLDLSRALRILRQTANGVHEAHQAQMIHRDLKPENIMVERLPAGDDFVHILDFGIVHRLDDVRVTHGFLGTPLYASPEQAVGGEIDRRSDIYSLGAVFFFMLTGQPPFFDDNVYKVLKDHVGTRPPRLSDIAPGTLFPEEIEHLVARMLAKKPDARPQTLAEVIETLDLFVYQHSEALHQATSVGDDCTEVSQPDSATFVQEAPHRTASTSQDGADNAAHHTPQSGIFRRKKSGASHHTLSAQPTPKAEVPPQPLARPDSAHDISGEASTIAEVSAPQLQDIFELPRKWAGSDLKYREDLPGQLRTQLPGASWAIVSPDNHLLSGLADAEIITTFELPENPVTALCRHADTLVTGHADGQILHWDLKTGEAQLIHQNASHAAISSMVCNDNFLLFGTTAGSLYMADVNAQPIQPLRVQSGAPVDVVAVVDQGNSAFAVARANGHIDIYHTSAPNSPVQRITLADPVDQLAFSRDGYLLAVAFKHKALAIYHTLTGAEIVRREALSRQPRSIHFNAEDQLIGYCQIDTEVFGWHLQNHLFSSKS